MRRDHAEDPKHRSKRWRYRLTETSASLSVHPNRRSRGALPAASAPPLGSPPPASSPPGPRPPSQDRAPRMLPGCTGVAPEQGENPLLRGLEATWKSRDERTRSSENETAGHRRRVARKKLLAKPGSPAGSTLRRPRDPAPAQ